MEEQMTQLEGWSEKAMAYVWEYGPNVVLAIVTLIIGLWIIGFITKSFRKVLEKKNMDPSLIPFLTTLVSVLLKVMLFISVIGMVGIEVTSFIAVLGAAGLAVGLALQGTLQNFAGGVVILLLRPFRVGDVVDVQGHLGTVKEIQIFYTIINTFDNKVIYVPNGDLANSDMTNLSQEPERRNEWVFGIGYGDDVDKAKDLLMKYVEEDDRILKEPAPMVAVKSLGDSSVNLVLRAWSKASDLWPVNFDMNEKVYKGFADAGLNIPFPQMDVHLFKEEQEQK